MDVLGKDVISLSVTLTTTIQFWIISRVMGVILVNLLSRNAANAFVAEKIPIFTARLTLLGPCQWSTGRGTT